MFVCREKGRAHFLGGIFGLDQKPKEVVLKTRTTTAKIKVNLVEMNDRNTGLPNC
jgi:hypothetical protein